MKVFFKENGPFKVKQSPFADLSMVQRSATLKNSIVLEDMAELDYIFTDKTGTLTKNEMKLLHIQDHTTKISFNSNNNRTDTEMVNIFMLALCNTVQVWQGEYFSESPDELAFA